MFDGHAPTADRRIAVADQDALPVFDQCLKCRFGTAAVQHEEGCRAVTHEPEPLQPFVALPGCLVDMIDRHAVDRLADGFIVAGDGAADPVQNFLNRSPADRNSYDGKHKIPHCPAAVTVNRSEFRHHGRHSRSKTGTHGLRDMRFDHFSAGGAVPPVQNNMTDVRLYRG